MYTRDQINKAKEGSHKIAFQPGREPKTCLVEKVEGDFVWVRTMEKVGDKFVVGQKTIRLNRAASTKLIAGGYR